MGSNQNFLRSLMNPHKSARNSMTTPYSIMKLPAASRRRAKAAMATVRRGAL
jgi:hypothetical protein